jgi:hypothetical protein
VVRPERANRELTSRCLQERQILATLDHPRIATLLDRGITARGTVGPGDAIRRRSSHNPLRRDTAADASRSAPAQLALGQKAAALAPLTTLVSRGYRSLDRKEFAPLAVMPSSKL